MSANLSAQSFDVSEMILSRFLLLSLSILFDSQYHAQAQSSHHGIHPTVVQIIAHAVPDIFCCNFDGL
jgi:hypothetical protein